MKLYRTDIDGLRAIAVLAVVIFHLNPRKLDGGFLGVDMFFVISGFLITGLTWKALEQQQFSLLEFYGKRIRRLFPALFAMLFVCAAVILLTGLPQDVENFGKSAIATTFYVSNFYFWSISDYFNGAAKSDPLLHTWSLSVEEQFYLFFPAVLILVHKFLRAKALPVFLLLALAFLGLSEFLLRENPSLAFYISPSRFWQFMAGGVLNFIALKDRFSAKFATGVAWTSLFILLACFSEYSDSTDYPGINSILPTLATAALILFGAVEGNSVTALLSKRPFRFFGEISYSVYLWHWPFIVFYKMQFGEFDSLTMLLLFSLTVILGYLSWRFVEQPFRSVSVKKQAGKIYVSAAFLMAVSAIISGIYISSDGFDDRYSPKALPIVKYLEKTDSNNPPLECFWALEISKSYAKDQCLKTDKHKKNVLLLGDSHMEHFAKALGDLFPEYQFSRVTGPGCRPLLPVKKSDSCRQLMQPVFDEYLKEYKFDAIVLGGRWDLDEVGKLEAAIDAIKAVHGNRIIVLGPVIEYRIPFPRLLLKYIDSDNMDEKVDRFNTYEKTSILDKRLEQVTKEKGVGYFSVLKALCTDSRCTHLVSGEPVQTDYGHLSYYGATHVVESLKQSGSL